jgi:CheY-like chemotaxis protein
MNNGKEKILIIDDDLRNIFALQAYLRTKGYDCIAVNNPLTGIDLLQTDNGISLVLLDIMMPEMDGYETVSRIRANEKIAHIPVIAVTARAMKEDREKALVAGANNYIAKPIDADELIKLIQLYKRG